MDLNITSTLSSLPVEKIYEICDKLDDKSLSRIIQTSSQFNSICRPILIKRRQNFYKELGELAQLIYNVKGPNGNSWTENDTLSSAQISLIIKYVDQLDKKLRTVQGYTKFKTIVKYLGFKFRQLIYEGLEDLPEIKELFILFYNDIKLNQSLLA